MMTMPVPKELRLLLVDDREESKRCIDALAQAGINYQLLPCSDLYEPVLMTRTRAYRGLERIQAYAQSTGQSVRSA